MNKKRVLSGIAIFFFFCFGMSISVNAEKLSVPNVEGLYMDEAETAMREAGFTNLKFNYSDETYSQIVTSQSLKSGSVVESTATIELECSKFCYFDLVVTSKYKLMFSKYDVDAYFGNHLAGTIGNGETVTFNCSSIAGKNEITFYKHGTKDNELNYSFQVTGDGTYTVELERSSSSITVSSENKNVNAKGTAVKVPDLVGLLLSDPEVKNLSIYYTHDCNTAEEKKRVITSQSLPAGALADKKRTLELKSIDFDMLLRKTYLGIPVSEISDKVKGQKYKYTLKDYYTKKRFDRSISAIPKDELPYWVVEDVSFKEGDGSLITLTLIYDGPTTVPNLKGLTFPKAKEALIEARISNYQFNKLTDAEIRLPDRWKVVEQGVKAGTEINSKELITVGIKRDEKAFKLSCTEKEDSSEIYIDQTKKYTFQIKPSDVAADDWEVVLDAPPMATITDKQVYSKKGKNYLSFVVNPKGIGTLDLYVLTDYDEESKHYQLVIKDYKLKTPISFKEQSDEMTVGNKVNWSLTVSYQNLTWDDVKITADKSSLVSIKKGEITQDGKKTVLAFTVTAKKKGTVELSLTPTEKNWSAPFVTIKIKEAKKTTSTSKSANTGGNNTTPATGGSGGSGSSGGNSGGSGGVTVYTTPSGECYHYSKSCAGKNARITTLDSAVSSGYRACKKCVK